MTILIGCPYCDASQATDRTAVIFDSEEQEFIYILCDHTFPLDAVVLIDPSESQSYYPGKSDDQQQLNDGDDQPQDGEQ